MESFSDMSNTTDILIFIHDINIELYHSDIVIIVYCCMLLCIYDNYNIITIIINP